MKPLFFKTQFDFSKWLAANHDKVAELLVGFHKKHTGKPSITYPEALDEALCYGWIDGVRKGIDDISYTIRFTPRRTDSIWSLVNIRRVRELKKDGLMKPAGIAAFEKRDPDASARRYSYEARNPEFAPAYLKKIKASPVAWAFFQLQPLGYRRIVSYWVMSAKQEETRLRRLAKLIESLEKKQRVV